MIAPTTSTCHSAFGLVMYMTASVYALYSWNIWSGRDDEKGAVQLSVNLAENARAASHKREGGGD